MKRKQKVDGLPEIDSLEEPTEPVEAIGTPDMNIVRRAAPGGPQQIQQAVQTVQQPAKPLATILDEKLTEFQGNLVQLQDWVFQNLQGPDLYTAGFQICLYATNKRLILDNTLRTALREMLDGMTEIPFDPRTEPKLFRLLKIK
jgi:hypothetical protein